MENYQLPSDKTNAGQGLGIAGLVLGIVAVILSFIPCFGIFALFFAVLAIIFGGVGLNQAKTANGKTGMPIAGLVLGIVATIFILLWTLVIAGIVAAGSTTAPSV
jgi:hypothetical protein